jgi:hypothetical protein
MIKIILRPIFINVFDVQGRNLTMRPAFGIAQLCSLPCRRFAIGIAPLNQLRLAVCKSAIQPTQVGATAAVSGHAGSTTLNKIFIDLSNTCLNYVFET